MLLKTIAAVLLSIPINSAKLFRRLPEDAILDTAGLAIKYGGAVEEYDVTTVDGYILKIYRIPGNKTRPVLYMHGLTGSSDDSIMRGKYSLAITLTNAGYDVWLGNYRGNRYSRRHVHLNPDTDSSFWKFGPHQHGNYDLAASIDFVLNKTAQRKLSLIAHSEGTMITYILGSEKPEYNDKIEVFIALAPVCHIYYEKIKIPLIEELHFVANRLFTLLNVDEVGSYHGKSAAMSRRFCAQTLLGMTLCRRLQFTLAGYDPEGLEYEFLPIVFSHLPAGTSRTNLQHFYQMVKSKRFQKFDYGAVENFKKYGSERPPEYNLRKVTMPIVMIVAKNDPLSVMEDTNLQSREFPNVEEYIILDDEKFNHNDFFLAKRAREMVFPKVLEVLQRHNQGALQAKTDETQKTG